jgi:hypothetical protein
MLADWPPEMYHVLEYIRRKALWQVLGVDYQTYNELTEGQAEDWFTIFLNDPKPGISDTFLEQIAGAAMVRL